MEIIKNQNGTALTVTLKGRLDTTTSPQLEEMLNTYYKSISDLTIDFSFLEYISSAGLRVILGAQKEMNKKGKMVIKNVNSDIMEIFEITGFIDILTIE